MTNVFRVSGGFETPSFPEAVKRAAALIMYGEPNEITDTHGCKWIVGRSANEIDYELVDCPSVFPCECAYLGTPRDEEEP